MTLSGQANEIAQHLGSAEWLQETVEGHIEPVDCFVMHLSHRTNFV
jgi:hypothetical protein